MKGAMRASLYPRFRGRRKPAAFTLVETVIAVGVVLTALLPVLSLLSLASGQSGDIEVSSQERRLLKISEELIEDRAFTEVYQWLSEEETVYCYQYASDPSASLRSDGSAAPWNAGPYTDATGFSIRLCATNDPFLASDLGVLDGQILELRLAQPSGASSPLPQPASSYLGADLIIEAQASMIVTPNAINPTGALSTPWQFRVRL